MIKIRGVKKIFIVFRGLFLSNDGVRSQIPSLYFLFVSLFYPIFLFTGTGCKTTEHSLIHSIRYSDSLHLKSDMDSMLNTNGYRNYSNINALNQVAGYIKKSFLAVSDSVWEQSFRCRKQDYKNIVCSINTEKKERIIIGAHYDVCGNQDGADDNASGVVSLLELARLLKNEKLNYRIDFVAYSLEEPPFFRSDGMGSAVHASYLYNNKIPVKGMICLEMLGYFNDQPGSQDYPVGFLKWFYGSKGDFIMIAQKFGNGSFGNEVKRTMKKLQLIPTKSIKAPSFLTGIDFSDHLNYWKYGYSAIMITNTSFYRNKNYHEGSDKKETLDFNRLSLTVDELYLAIKQLK